MTSTVPPRIPTAVFEPSLPDARPDSTLGEWIEQAINEERIRDARPENSPLVQWAKRTLDEPPPRNPVLDFLTSP